jgi:TPR repeat protein
MSSFRHILPTLLILTLLSAALTLDRAASAATGVPGKYPQASTRTLDLTDLEGLSPWELRVMRNEIFARKGFIFNKGKLATYFRSQPWYTPSSNDVAEQLSETERANILLIKFQEGKLAYKNQNYEQAYENFLVAAQHRNVAAVNYLGMMYEHGYGVDKNLELAREFYKLAAGTGDDWAQERLREIFGKEEEASTRTAEQRSEKRLEQRRCVTIAEGDSITGVVRNGASPCYRYAVASGNLPVLTLKPLDDGMDVDLVVYSDSELSEQLATSTAAGSSTELLTLWIPQAAREVYVTVVKHTSGNGEYTLYAEQVNLVGKAAEAALSATGQAFLRWGMDKFLGTNEETTTTENEKRSTFAHLDRAFSVASSLLQGRSLATTSRNFLINEVKRELVGDGFMSDFAVSFTLSIVDDIFKHY